MSTKQQELGHPEGCFNKAALDEPIFVLRANDPVAPMVVRVWASLSAQMGAHKPYKTVAAVDVAQDMEAWYAEKYGAVRHEWRTEPGLTAAEIRAFRGLNGG